MRSSFNKNEKIIIIGCSSIISGLSGMLFFETTKNAQPYEKISTIASNVIINFLTSEKSMEYFLDAFKQKEYKKVLVVFLLAGGMYIPQVLISVLESPYSTAFTAFAATAAFLSGAALNAFSLTMIGDRFSSIFRTLRSNVSYPVYHMLGGDLTRDDFSRYKNLIENIEKFRKVTALDTANLIISNDQVEILPIQALEKFQSRLLETQTTSYWSYVTNIIIILSKIAASVALLYSTVGYACGAEVTLRKKLHFPPHAAVIVANFLMSCMYVLNLKAGYELVNSGVHYLSKITYRRTSNELEEHFLAQSRQQEEALNADIIPTQDGQHDKKNRLVTIGLGLASVFIASCSGASAKNLYQTTCPQSEMKPLMLPSGSTMIYYSESADNAIYVALSLYLIFCVVKNTTPAITLTDAIEDLVEKVKSTTDLNRIRLWIGSSNFDAYSQKNSSEILEKREECNL